jgi:hypothetical protein
VINLLCLSNPTIVDINNAAVLVSYIRPTTSNPDENTSNDLILKILKRSIPHMPKAASTFAADLNKMLLPMISKPYGGINVSLSHPQYSLADRSVVYSGDCWLFLCGGGEIDKGL